MEQREKVFFRSLLFISAVLLVCFSCGGPDKKKTVSVRHSPEKDTISCDKQGEREGPEVSITSRLEFVDSQNAGEYLLKGRCSQRKQEVQITVNDFVNDFPLKEYPVCKNGRWEVSLDLTGLAGEGMEKIQFKVRQGKRSNVACKEVKVAFGCPENYVPVPPLEDYYENAFCVMKYEAKVPDKNDPKALSVPEGQPVSSVSHEVAVKLCRNNGNRYDLIKNEQWQTIVRHIEEEDENWFSGRASRTQGNFLNCGVNTGRPQEASLNDEDNCNHSSCTGESRNYYSRTHFLPGGHVIWDLCGNVGEMMKDENKASYSFRDPVYLLKGDAKDRFGPKKEYAETESNRRLQRRGEGRYWGLGEAELSRDGSLIIRGAQSVNAGIFSVSLERGQDSRIPNNVGFRCVYIP